MSEDAIAFVEKHVLHGAPIWDRSDAELWGRKAAGNDRM